MRTIERTRLAVFALMVMFLSRPGLALADSAGGLTWTPPAAWKVDAPRQMRIATYKIPAARGDTEEAECAIFYFGAGQGGSVDANVQRWAGQFKDAKPPAQKKQKVAGFDLTTLEIDGTYLGGMAMTPGASAEKPNYVLLGAIAEGPSGPVFFKLTGPKKTIESARAAFSKMTKQITK